MASADPSEELECFICLNLSSDPVTLKCGHNCCLDCIGHVLDTQERSEGYSCPKCKEEFEELPTLRNMVDNFLSARPDQEEFGVTCTPCSHTPVPAIKSCLSHRGASPCNHLGFHSKSPEHVFCDLATSLENRKCSVHKELLKYYCTKDSTCICLSCRLDEEHWEHQVETLDKASEIKKKKLRNVLPKLMAEREEMEERVQSLQEHWRKVQGKADDETERVTVLFRDLGRRLDDLERRVLSDISGQVERVSLSVSDLIQQLEIKEEELVRKMADIEDLCNTTDPLTVLQESDTSDLCDEDRERHDELLYDGGDLNVAGISQTLHIGLSDIMSGVNVHSFAGTHVYPIFCAKNKVISGLTDLLLDVSTAGNTLRIADDRKTLSFSSSHLNLPETPERFWCSQVLSSQSFSSGRHCWEVNVRGSNWWRIGMCYPSIDRRGVQSVIGYNEKSWCLERYGGNSYSVIHGSKEIPIPGSVYGNRIRIDLNYGAGRISFYELCDPIRFLITITTTFTEPLHAGLGVWNGCIRLSLAYQM
ncbi:E3 ubiquitin/ISG15 ligase TRIM25-like [Rana temporaria]|uniref:E3 ubiquitin/ISG15 ligase TRIM25-like n=1 Tax=Rana temporaria TaxID=8407 RepID=UPI001AAC8DE0|nr:E3 ubiquitin/ISG15 ligase TRIM25-like [Rana temporaria]